MVGLDWIAFEFLCVVYIIEMREVLVELLELREEKTTSAVVDVQHYFMLAFLEFPYEMFKHSEWEILTLYEFSFSVDERKQCDFELNPENILNHDSLIETSSHRLHSALVQQELRVHKFLQLRSIQEIL